MYWGSCEMLVNRRKDEVGSSGVMCLVVVNEMYCSFCDSNNEYADNI